jgi:dynein heavy chain
MQLVEMLSRELDAVQQVFEAGKDKAPPYLNMPHHASRIMWSRSLSDRLQGPMACAQRMLSNVMLTPPGRSVSERYEQLLATLKAFEEKEIQVWLEQIDLKFAEKLKKPLLVRDLTSTGIRVNFDQGLMALLREAKYLNLINIDMPDGVRGVYSKADVYQQHEANLHLIVNDYNALLRAMNEVEVPLMLPKLELVDEALEEGIELLNWRNHSIASFIKKSTSYIADASGLLKVLQTNVKRICDLLKGWSTASLHTNRKKTLGAEEYLQNLQGTIQTRYNAFREDSHMIGNLIGEIHLALQVSRGDAAWRQYIAHVNLLITTTLRESVIESFEAIIAMLDPAQRKEGSAALVEVRLELVAPDVFFNPDVNSNLSGSGLEDIVEFWISSTLGVA